MVVWKPASLIAERDTMTSLAGQTLPPKKKKKTHKKQQQQLATFCDSQLSHVTGLQSVHDKYVLKSFLLVENMIFLSCMQNN